MDQPTETDATLPAIDSLLDAMPQASDLEIARQVEEYFPEFFGMRETVKAQGFHIDSTGELAAKVHSRRMRRSGSYRAVSSPPEENAEFAQAREDLEDLRRDIHKAVEQFADCGRQLRKLQAAIELRNFSLRRARLTAAAATLE